MRDANLRAVDSRSREERHWRFVTSRCATHSADRFNSRRGRSCWANARVHDVPVGRPPPIFPAPGQPKRECQLDFLRVLPERRGRSWRKAQPLRNSLGGSAEVVVRRVFCRYAAGDARRSGRTATKDGHSCLIAARGAGRILAARVREFALPFRNEHAVRRLILGRSNTCEASEYDHQRASRRDNSRRCRHSGLQE